MDHPMDTDPRGVHAQRWNDEEGRGLWLTS
jgi:hypothetical protein